jgi:hypothetical protein
MFAHEILGWDTFCSSSLSFHSLLPGHLSTNQHFGRRCLARLCPRRQLTRKTLAGSRTKNVCQYEAPAFSDVDSAFSEIYNTALYSEIDNDL